MSADNPVRNLARLSRSQRVTREAIRREATKLWVVSLIVSVVWVIGVSVDSSFLTMVSNGGIFGILITIPMAVLHVLKVQKAAEDLEIRENEDD